MKLKNRKLCSILLFILIQSFIFSQEELKSDVEDYYDFLSLSGLIERPYLNYRTLSDSVWKMNEGTSHIWENINLAGQHRISDKMSYIVYTPKLFSSFNLAAPYGQNDGALWQGKGFNIDLKAGAGFYCYGLELTFKPQLSFSQNMRFVYTKSNSAYKGKLYIDKADKYGYYGIRHIDAPQRFGDKPFFMYDWGDTEIRYSYKTFTVGFGTQNIWLGPARINPIIHSNNAPAYPKFDIGMRKQSVILGRWNAGFMEFRTWWGMLQESKYFDHNEKNDKNLITGITFSYSPSFIPGFTFGINRIMLSKWSDKDWKSIFTLLIPFMKTSAGSDARDQRASLCFKYNLKQVGLDIYLEWGRNDFSPSTRYVVNYPFHTQAYTIGLKKNINFLSNLKGEVIFEHTNIEASKDYLRLISWDTTFYAHHKITQGHTNRGQWLGAGIGTGGNSQYFGFKLYYPQGFSEIYINRVNPDNDYTWFKDFRERNIRTNLCFGLKTKYSVIKNLWIGGKIVFIHEYNPTNNVKEKPNRFNLSTALSIQYVY